MYNHLSEIYYWPSMYKDVHDYCVSCESCQANKPRTHAPAGTAQPILPPELPWTSVGMDFVGPLPMSTHGHNYMITFTDYLTRCIRTVPVRCDDVNSFQARDLAEIYFTYIFRYHGLPSAVHTDRGSVFTSEFWTSLMSLCGTKLKTSTAYHPQTQGLTERANHTIIHTLKHYLESLYETWDDHLIAAEFAYNTSVHQGLGMTPFEAQYGFNPRAPLTLDAHSYLSSSKSARYLENIRARVDAAREHLLQHQLSQAAALNRHRTTPSIVEGERVWLSTENLTLPYPTKFTPAYLGPFLVTHMNPHSNAATLELPASLSRLHPTFNTALLKPYHVRDPVLGPSAHAQPPPIYSDETGQYYIIERIIAEKRSANNEPLYTIKWSGYPHSQNTISTHTFLSNEPGGQLAITAWRNRQAAVPTLAPQDRAARHRYRGPHPDPLQPAAPDPAPAPAPAAPPQPAPQAAAQPIQQQPAPQAQAAALPRSKYGRPLRPSNHRGS